MNYIKCLTCWLKKYRRVLFRLLSCVYTFSHSPRCTTGHLWFKRCSKNKFLYGICICFRLIILVIFSHCYCLDRFVWLTTVPKTKSGTRWISPGMESQKRCLKLKEGGSSSAEAYTGFHFVRCKFIICPVENLLHLLCRPFQVQCMTILVGYKSVHILIGDVPV